LASARRRLDNSEVVDGLLQPSRLSDFTVCTVVTTNVKFATTPAPVSDTAPEHVDGRTAREWLKSAMQYCRWRSGDDWRSRRNEGWRRNPDRMMWVDAESLLTDILYTASDK
jgi:hypothetical protein